MADTFKPDTPSSDHDYMDQYWSIACDLLEGAAAVRDAGEKYLPRLPDEELSAYEFRRKNAKYVNIFSDIVTSLAAKPFRKEVAIKDGSASAQLRDLCEDVDGCGNNLHVFAGETFFSGLAFALDWIFVDHTPKLPEREDGRAYTLAESRKLGARPYWIRVPAQNVLAVESAQIGGREQFTHVRFLEHDTRREGMKDVAVTRVRIIDRTRNGDGSYGPPLWQIYEKVTGRSGSTTWVLLDSGIMTIGVIPLVPFLAGRRQGGSWRVTPPMRGAADLQIEHYQQEAALKAIKELVAFPMLSGAGVQPELDAGGNAKPIRVGPRSVLYAPPAGDGRAAGKWEFVEPQGNSLNFLADQIKATEEQLRELGRQPLTAQTGNLTVVTTAFAASRSNSVISAWALNLKDALERALGFTALWLNDSSQPEVAVEDDFDIDLQDDRSTDTLVEMRKNGDLSQLTFWSEMKRRGVLSAEFDPAKEQKALIEEMPDADGFDDLAAAGHHDNDETPAEEGDAPEIAA